MNLSQTDFETYICPTTAHVRLKQAKSGVLPAALGGIYTSVREANAAVTRYLASVDSVPLKDKKAKLESLED
jgi:hypothetical protein